jgi:hypothetical protein
MSVVYPARIQSFFMLVLFVDLLGPVLVPVELMEVPSRVLQDFYEPLFLF